MKIYEKKQKVTKDIDARVIGQLQLNKDIENILQKILEFQSVFIKKYQLVEIQTF